MAFFQRYASAPLLTEDADFSLSSSSTRTTENQSDEESVTSDSYYTREHSTSSPPEVVSIQSFSESEQSPVVLRRGSKKKRRAPPPPTQSSSLTEKCDALNISRLSADSVCSRIESLLLPYQTSTDSENVADSEAATEEQSEGDEPSRSGQPSPQISPKDRSRLWALKNALRSPRNIRKTPRVDPKNDDDKMGFTSWRNTIIEPPEFSVCTFAFLSEDLWDMDTEFEVKRIPEYEKYLTELLQGTPEAHPDYEQLSRSVKKVQDTPK
ncbi:hypothetical protein C0Q70_11381 [Pomacea canaliculata]|uniref:DH domain-containing protein n=1 Tax=Pomacea canaliculata TaxID=400727 RepID=A0A2T7P5W0_POMCA|nr:hypothetical protein C0Q70_11381 [Pomacea canaliculata]